ncbi:MAG: hypothetical protein JWO52_7139 [Gammaproteobacteria bacterium]|nr:hypothetical protein [Gammaproteobacteria bacterium]
MLVTRGARERPTSTQRHQNVFTNSSRGEVERCTQRNSRKRFLGIGAHTQERARSAHSRGSSADSNRCVDSTSVRADLGGEVNIGLRVALGQARRSGGTCDAGVGCSVSPVWPSLYPGLPGASRTPDERRSSSSPVAAMWHASATKTALATDCERPPAPVAGNGRRISVVNNPPAGGERGQLKTYPDRPDLLEAQRRLLSYEPALVPGFAMSSTAAF